MAGPTHIQKKAPPPNPPSPLDECVVLDGFCMDKTEVTEAAYAAVTGQSPSDNGHAGFIKLSPNDVAVTNVSYQDASRFCEKVGKRLPTGAEWAKFAGPNEFATADGKLFKTRGIEILHEANIFGLQQLEVAHFFPNGHGMHDMTGGVWEWVNEDLTFKDLPQNGYKQVRGGSWKTSEAVFLRVTWNSYGLNPSAKSDEVGFRCVKDKK